MTAPPERRAQAGDRHQRWNLRRRPAGPRSAIRRRLGTVARLAGALVLMGTLYAGFAPGVQATAETNQPSAQDVAAGKALYETSCISCHGRNAQGVQDRGPSLVGVGPASVEFQVGTGRMPLSSQNAQAQRKPPVFKADETRQLGAYIESLGGGPSIPDVSLAGGDVAVGGDLFRVNCSSCHAFGGGGGALSSGKTAPGLDQATDRQIYAAMLTGPQNMPVFGDNQLTIDEKKAIIAYVQNLQTDPDPGGWGLGRLGPVSEGVAIFLVGIVALVFATLWIAGKS